MNILVISTGSGLFKPKTGDRSRFFNLAVQLSKRNKIYVLQPYRVKDISDPTIGHTTYFNTSFGINIGLFSDFNPDFMIKLMKNLINENIDIIQISHPSGIVVSKVLSRLFRRNIPIIYDAHNVDSDSIQSAKYSIKISDSPIKRLKSRLILFFLPLIETIAVHYADYIISVSDTDQNRFINKFGINPQKITVIPNGVQIGVTASRMDINKYPEINLSQKKITIIFHGSFSQSANREAFDLINTYIAPTYAKTAANQDVMFLIAGTDCPIFEKNNIRSLGFVNDIYSLLHLVDIAIVPIRSGGGTKLKVLDYMGVGLPIVTTNNGIEGIKARNGDDAIVVDDVNKNFIDAINFLVSNEKERKRIGANARKLAEEEYDWDKIGKKLDTLYREIIVN